MKRRKTNGRINQRFAIKSHRKIAGVVVATLALAIIGGGSYVLIGKSPNAEARDYNAEIKALENQIDKYNQRSAELSKQADSLSGRIAQLQNQQSEIQAQINLSESKKNQLQSQIDDTQKKIKKQAEALSIVLRDYYYSNQTTTLDILMNSNSVSDYIDRESRQKSITQQIASTVEEVKEAKKELEKKKDEVEQILKRQSAQKQDLANTQAEQQKLLDETQGLEDKYRELTASKKEQLAQVHREQAEENARLLAASRVVYTGGGSSCGGGYPASLCNAGQDALVDPWGMYNRECVSYTAFKVASTYGWPRYWSWGGNDAKYWLSKARGYGIKTSSTPAPGTVAVLTSGIYGHVAWVEAVNGNTITVSDYNVRGDGTYSRYTTSASSFTGYIYFGEQ